MASLEREDESLNSYVTPTKDMTVQVPYDLQESVRQMAANAGKSTNKYLENVLRYAIELECLKKSKRIKK